MFPSIARLSDYEKSQITGYDESIGSFTFNVDESDLLVCGTCGSTNIEDKNMKRSPSNYSFCPYCGKDF